MSASPATVRSGAGYLGTSTKMLQKCLTLGYSGKQAAQYLGQAVAGVQKAFAKYHIVTVTVTGNATGGVVTVVASGNTPGANVQIAWDDATSTTANCDSSGNLTRSHTYAAQGTYAIISTDFGTGASSSAVSVVTKP